MEFNLMYGSSKGRRPSALLRGKTYKVETFKREKSKFPNKAGEYDTKLIAVYQDFGKKFHTYMPKEFDNKDDDFMKNINSKINNGDNIRIVFYGIISCSNEMEILMNDEDVNAEKLEGIKLIEESEKGCTSTPTKRSIEPAPSASFHSVNSEDSFGDFDTKSDDSSPNVKRLKFE